MTTREEIRATVDAAARIRMSLNGQDTEPMLRQALALAEETFGADSEDVIAPLEELARVLHLRAGCLVADPEGLELGERAYSIASKFPGPDNHRLAFVTDSLGHWLTNTPDGLERGLQLMRDALSLVDANPVLASRASQISAGLANTLIIHERFSEALPYAHRSLELEGGNEHTYMYVGAVLLVGQALHGSGELAQSIPYCARAKTLAEQSGRRGLRRLADEATRLIEDAQQKLASSGG